MNQLEKILDELAILLEKDMDRQLKIHNLKNQILEIMKKENENVLASEKHKLIFSITKDGQLEIRELITEGR